MRTDAPAASVGKIHDHGETKESGDNSVPVVTAPLVSSPADGSGRLFIVQQTGQVLILQNGAVLPTPFIDVSARMVELMPEYTAWLIGLCLSSGFQHSSAPGFHKIYTYTCEPVSQKADFTVLIRVRLIAKA